MTSETTVVIVGAGLVGSLAALQLAQRGFRVAVYERRPDIRGAAVVSGNRSINLALSVRGISALRLAGIAEEVLARAIPMRGRMVYPLGREPREQLYGTFGEAINSVDRAVLNRLLLDRAEGHGVALHFEHTLEALDAAAGEAVFLHRYAGGGRALPDAV